MRASYVAPLIQLAPMEGVLDSILRDCLSEIGGVDRMVTEFVRITERVLPDHVFLKYCPELETGGRTRHGIPVFVQLLGGKPEPMARNAERLVVLGAPGVDLNFGCPAKTVNRHDGGATLLKEPRRLFEVASAVRQAVAGRIPVTAKVRLGFDHKDFHREIASALEDAGVDHIVVHARTKTEMYTPPAHWSFIKSMREGRTVPFLANGEIWSVDDYRRCREASGVSSVALGRGLVARPTLALEIQSFLVPEKSATAVEKFCPIEFLERFWRKNLEIRGPAFALARLKQVLRYWSRSEDFAPWFDRAKVFSSALETELFFKNLRKAPPWTSSFTPKKAAPTACAPSNF